MAALGATICKQASVAVVYPFVKTNLVNIRRIAPFCRVFGYGHEGMMRLFNCSNHDILFQDAQRQGGG